MSDMNNLDPMQNESQVDIFKEETIDSLDIKINPEGVPLINGKTYFIDENGVEREPSKRSRFFAFQEKTLLIDDYKLYIHTAGSEEFKTYNTFENAGGDINTNEFLRTGDMLLSQRTREGMSIMINGKAYTGNNEVLEIGNMHCKAQIKGDKLYASRGGSGKLYIYHLIDDKENKIILESIKDLGKDGFVRFFADNIIEKTDGHIVVNGKKRENKINPEVSCIESSGDNVVAWEEREKIIINDKPYPLGDRKGQTHRVQMTPNGKLVAIHYQYNSDNSGKYGYYILVGNEQGITQEIPVINHVWKMIIDDTGSLAYITKDSEYRAKLHINGFTQPIDLNFKNDSWLNIKEFNFIDKDTINIKYVDSNNTICHKHISLNKDAEEIQTKLEQEEQEKKEQFNIQSWLKKNDIRSLQQLEDLAHEAAEVDGLTKKIQSQEERNSELLLTIQSLQEEKKKLEAKNTLLESSKSTLEQEKVTIKNGVTPGTFGYKISPEVKTILGIK